MASSIENKTRDIERRSRNVKTGHEYEALQEAQNQLLSIQEAQRQNLGAQANNSMRFQEQNQLLGQAAEIMSMQDLNPTTQSTLSSYGLNQPRVIKETKVVKQGPYNITINNNTTNNTQGPVQGREISIRPQQEQQGRFKAWLNNVFARQDAIFQKQNSEYVKKENALTRSANKMTRVIEKLGKEIGRVMDPRRIADTQKNQLKTILTIIGIPLLIKYLPKALDTIGNISNFIKDGFSKISAFFKGDDNDEDSSFLGKLAKKLYNDEESGILNKLSEKLREKLMDRVNLANTTVNLKGLRKFNVKNLIEWFGVFLGGEKFAMQQERKEAMKKIGKGMNDQGDVYENFKRYNAADRNGTNLELNGSSRFGISSVSGGTLGKNDYKDWLKEKGKKKSDETAKEFLNEKGFVYTGEAVVLTKEAYDNYVSRVFNPKYDLNSLGQLEKSSLYPPLVASLEFIHELKRGHSNHHTEQRSQNFGRAVLAGLGAGAGAGVGMAIGMIALPAGIIAGIAGAFAGGTWVNNALKNNEKTFSSNLNAKTDPNVLTYILYLLTERSKSSIAKTIVFPEFVELVCTKELQQALQKDGDLNKIKIKLVKQGMDLSDIRKYWKNQNYGLSDYYKKITYSTISGEAIPLDGKDFNGKAGSTEWEVYHITGKGMGRIFELISNGQKEINLTKGTQTQVINNIEANAKDNKVDVGPNKDIKVENRTVSKSYDRAHNNWVESENRREEYIKEHEKRQGDEDLSKYDSYTIKPGWGKGLTKEEYNKNVAEIYNYLKKKGLTDVQIAGIMGVLQAESGLNPAAINKTEVKRFGKGTAGEGIAQWTNHGRKDPMLDWVRARYGSVPEDGIMGLTLNQQLEYFWKEFTGRKKVFDIITKSDDLATIVDAMVRGYENGSTNALASKDVWPRVYKHEYSKAFGPRMGYANGFMAMFGSPTFQQDAKIVADSSVPGAIISTQNAKDEAVKRAEGNGAATSSTIARNVGWNKTNGFLNNPFATKTSEEIVAEARGYSVKPSSVTEESSPVSAAVGGVVKLSERMAKIQAAHNEEITKQKEIEAHRFDASKAVTELVAEIGKKTVDLDNVIRNIDTNLATVGNTMPNRDKKNPLRATSVKTKKP